MKEFYEYVLAHYHVLKYGTCRRIMEKIIVYANDNFTDNEYKLTPKGVAFIANMLEISGITEQEIHDNWIPMLPYC